MFDYLLVSLRISAMTTQAFRRQPPGKEPCSDFGKCRGAQMGTALVDCCEFIARRRL
jgi:hypothetical protein